MLEHINDAYKKITDHRDLVATTATEAFLRLGIDPLLTEELMYAFKKVYEMGFDNGMRNAL